VAEIAETFNAGITEISEGLFIFDRSDLVRDVRTPGGRLDREDTVITSATCADRRS